jgi:flagellin
MHLFDTRAEALGLRASDGTPIQMTTREKATAAMDMLDEAMDYLLDVQTTIGAMQSRLEHTVNNLTIASESVQQSESTIRDADMAKEMTEYTKHNVLMQMAQAMLAQSNQSSSSVLSLLQ